MTILLAPDKFKGSLSAQQVCDAIMEGINDVNREATIVCLPLADGGEGTCELLTTYSGGTMIAVKVRDPLFREIDSAYGISADGTTAFLEMAKASGLQLLKKTERDPSLTSTVGTGDLIRHALDKGVTKIIMGIGGSATNDGGIGMAEALGLTFYSSRNEKLKPIGGNLKHIDRIDATQLHRRLRDVDITIFCDVDNPLHGRNGAAYVFSPQKGADEKMVEDLDQGLAHYQTVVERTFSKQINFPGAGAGGGLPSMIKAITNVTVRPGMKFIRDFISLEDHIRSADLIITGEGKIDEQTLSGKVVRGVADLAAKHNKAVIAIAGRNDLDETRLKELNLLRLITLVDNGTSEEEAMTNAFQLVSRNVSGVLRQYLANSGAA